MTQTHPPAQTPLSDRADEKKRRQIAEKYDGETVSRKLGGMTGNVTRALLIAMSLYHLYTSAFGLLPAIQHRALHLMFVLPLSFLLYPATKKRKGRGASKLDIALAAAGAVGAGYVVFDYNNMIYRGGMPNSLDIALAVLTTVLVLEAVRRTNGIALVIIPVVFLLYAYFGQSMPGIFLHKGVPLSRLTNHMYMITEGIFGVSLGTCATYIVLFVIFSAFLEKSGLGGLINDLALALTGWSAGGPAKISVVTSALFGTISGSAVANVVTTGAFTIPLMKKTGFPGTFAGAVEAVASTGGQLMPPIMGAAAFIMADTLGVSYMVVVKAALIPVLLYYASAFIMVHLRAKKLGLSGISRENLPRVLDILKKRGHLLIPFIAVIVMLVMQYTPLFAGSWGIALVIVVAALRKDTRMRPRDILWALENGAKRSIGVSVCCASVGLIVGVCTLTGVSNILGSYILRLGQGNLILTLALVMVMSIFMGMGLPTVAVYMLLASVAVPILSKMGVTLIAAHFFVFYFGLMAGLTPPVAVTAYAAAGLADANPGKTAMAGVKLALGGFLVPYTFVLAPELLFADGFTLWQSLYTALSAFLGITLLGIAIEGWHLKRALPAALRCVLLAAALGLVYPGVITDAAGVCVFALVTLAQFLRRKTRPDAA